MMGAKGVLVPGLLAIGLGLANARDARAGGAKPVFPELRKGAEPATCSVAGIPMGGERDQVAGLMDAAHLACLLKTASSTEYEGFPDAAAGVKRTRTHFHNDRLYRLTLVYSQGERDGYGDFTELRKALVARYGDPEVGYGDDAATLESAQWKGICAGKMRIDLSWEADGATLSLSYFFVPVYEELLKSLTAPPAP